MEGLSLKIALPAERAMYQHRYVPSWVPTSGFVPAGEGAVDKTSFIVDVANEAFAALDESGYVKADFLSYFDPVPPATTDMPDVYVSAYRRDDGRALVIVSNAGKDDRQGRVSINAERLNLPLSNVYPIFRIQKRKNNFIK